MALDVKYPPKTAKEACDFLSLLIQRIDMKIAPVEANPHGYYCECPGNEGVTASGILETSHTVLHSWDQQYPAKFQFDLYSCKDYDIPYVISICNIFGIIKGFYRVTDRNDILEDLERGHLGEDGKITKKLKVYKEYEAEEKEQPIYKGTPSYSRDLPPISPLNLPKEQWHG